MILAFTSLGDQAGEMDVFETQRFQSKNWPSAHGTLCDPLRKRLRQWQQVRTWARLIREAESLWHVDVKEIRRLGALELSQLLEEVPPAQRGRVNRWLHRYSVATRFKGNHKF